jgi:putative nucleotidyltransferase with HDIG domain
MRVVNSAYYSRRYTIQDLKQAISLLGFLEVRNLALTVYVSQLFESPVFVGEYSREALWEHLVAVATASRMIAQQCGHPAPEEAYLAGLLHDIGFLLLDQTIHRRFCQVLGLIDENVPTCRVEMRVLTFDHAELGAFVAQKWSLPEHVVAVARYHHNPEAYDGPSRTTVDAVVVANFLCSRRGMSSLGVHNVEPPPQVVFERLGIDRDHLTHIWDRLEEELEKSAAVIASH